ncbi:metal-binding protein [Egbenema bharatensis]|uniref:metal-binding protein n=1 Tax=Egbenema bharatensis TaxID=3463334 RepID=UPI003A845251
MPFYNLSLVDRLMPSGRTHDRITLWTLPLVAGLVQVMVQRSTLTLMICGGFLFGGLMMGPDLDTHSIHYKRWGIFRWIWLPYRHSMRHRSSWFHGPIMGTTVRVLYLILWLGLVSLIGVATVNELTQIGWSWSQLGQFWLRQFYRYHLEMLALFAGLELGAFSHYTADWLVSGYKRRKSKRAKRRKKSN